MAIRRTVIPSVKLMRTVKTQVGGRSPNWAQQLAAAACAYMSRGCVTRHMATQQCLQGRFANHCTFANPETASSHLLISKSNVVVQSHFCSNNGQKM